MSTFTLNPSQTILLIVDMQEKIFNTIDRGADILQTICKLIRGFQILELPILISEQYPQGLGETILPLKQSLGHLYQPWIKTSFSCLDNPNFFNHLISVPQNQWIVVGIEAHICILQTVKSLLQAGKQVTVLNDAISSRSIYDFSTAIAEMRDAGARISCVETILFELIKDSNHSKFKSISDLIKVCCQC